MALHHYSPHLSPSCCRLLFVLLSTFFSSTAVILMLFIPLLLFHSAVQCCDDKENERMDISCGKMHQEDSRQSAEMTNNNIIIESDSDNIPSPHMGHDDNQFLHFLFAHSHSSSSSSSISSSSSSSQQSSNSGGHHKSPSLPPPSIRSINEFFEHFFAVENSIDKAQWDTALPSEEERKEMRLLISFLYHLDGFDRIAANSSFLAQYAPLLAKSLQLTFIRDQYCILHERLPKTGPARDQPRFHRFWGYLAIQSPVYATRPHLHHSSPHFQSDGDVCNQAAAIFERTGSRSLVVSGACRFAVTNNAKSPCQPKFALADAAHNDATMFHTMLAALWEAAQSQTSNSSKQTTFIQWHGMAETTCPNSSAFLSVGAMGGHPIYKDENAAVNRLMASVNRLIGHNGACTPRQDRTCKLVASTNVFGRIVNGVPSGQCCQTPAAQKNVTGQFIHVEQNRALRDNWDVWTHAIMETFPADGQISTTKN